jgi:hypothetical protein
MRRSFETPTLTDYGNAIVQTLGTQEHSVEHGGGHMYAAGTDTRVLGIVEVTDFPATTNS